MQCSSTKDKVKGGRPKQNTFLGSDNRTHPPTSESDPASYATWTHKASMLLHSTEYFLLDAKRKGCVDVLILD